MAGIEPALLLSTAAFIALALAVAIFARRAGRVLGETREAESFRRGVADLTQRAERSLGGVSERIDALRRHQVMPPDVGPNLAAAIDAVGRYAEEARSLRPPAAFTAVQAEIVEELERAERALELVVHGCDILGEGRPRGRELEAQTSIKRGYLNVLHAREAVARHAANVALIRTPHEVRSVLRRTNG
jgi:hypothetical protein